MSRAVPEWIGKTDDTPVPPRVQRRVYDAHGGVCYLADRKIMPGEEWDTDHKIALCNGGENRESNLAPVLRVKHREKTARDVAEKAKVERIRQKHLGIYKSAHPMRSRPFPKRSEIQP
ncbi:HNH endonuclease signature motif containing protein [Kaistia terrae]|uniref:HNH endonuclease signature motif containing protein n=1 Tax=Kaistia terrae TaxID=537017 RepID=A0ABW0Q8I4_9HYPH|nr:HNH endonuclease signature motif containing protein [Kaistia terrae]MCX5581466.1 HNH endonuclease signature motif containing protein [Kaistia terrae]